jgi:hypothetical protein
MKDVAQTDHFSNGSPFVVAALMRPAHRPDESGHYERSLGPGNE